MIPFRVQLRPGLPIYEQIVYAATKAIVSGRMQPGDAFPSVRAISKELKINPNTAQKVVARLVEAGLVEIRSGIGAAVAVLPEASMKERTRLLENEIEALVVEAKRLGIDWEELETSMSDHWKRLSKRPWRAELE
jgi:GntR family transcriptional regulator